LSSTYPREETGAALSVSEQQLHAAKLLAATLKQSCPAPACILSFFPFCAVFFPWRGPGLGWAMDPYIQPLDRT